MERIILASASPRRAELLRQVGLDFDIIASDAEEEIRDLPPADLVKDLAYQKGRTVSNLVSLGIVIAADTIVVKDGCVLGKPSNIDDATKMLAYLNGSNHEVYTGLSLIHMPSGKSFLDFACTKVSFRKLTAEEINAYINTGEPMDKAGAYGIQGKGALLVEKIEGCYFNVVGLPLSLLYKALTGFGVEILARSRNNNA